MEAAGIPLGRAFNTLGQGESEHLRKVAKRIAEALEKGSELAVAGARAGFFTADEIPVVRAGETSGRLGEVLRRLAENQEQREKLQAQVKARLWLPGAVIVLAVFVAPLPALVGGAIELGDYFARTLGVLTVLAVGGRCLVFTARALWRAPPTRIAMAGLVLALPLVGKVHKRRQVLHALETLRMHEAAGIPLQQALASAADSPSNENVRRSFTSAAKRLNNGSTLGQALGPVAFLERGAVSLIDSAEASGRIEQLLTQLVAAERMGLVEDDKMLGDWLPRIVYFTVGAWMISQIMGSGLGMPVAG